MARTTHERYDELYDSDETWIEFVQEWMEKHEDSVEEIVSDYLTNKFNSEDFTTMEAYAEFVNKKLEDDYSQAMDEAYERYKEDRLFGQ